MIKYVGRVVEIVYLDRNEKITQRKIQVSSVKGGKVKAFCLEQKAPRIFDEDRILAALPVSGKRSG